MTDADRTLADRSRRGDREAFEELVRRTSRLVFSRIYLETGDIHTSEDLTQETYLSAWSRIGQLVDAGLFRSWLLSIAHRTVVDAARSKSRKKRGGSKDDLAGASQVTTGAPMPDEAMADQEQREKALSILRCLPEEYRQPLMLRYLAGADYDAISRQLAISNGSLRGLLQRGMAMLRSEMNRGEP